MSLSKVKLVNPNTNPTTTAHMLAIAREEARGRIVLEGVTAEFGVSLITSEAELAQAGDAVLSLVPRPAKNWGGFIVSAFGDPGVARLRTLVDVPVIGIGEAGIREAAAGGRRFCVATTTPSLVAAIDMRVAALGLGANYAGVVLTEGDAVAVTNDPLRLETELAAAVARAVTDLRVEAVVIGGGPLSNAARDLARASAVGIVEPIPAAVRLMIAALNS